MNYKKILRLITTDKEIDTNYIINNLTVHEVFGVEKKWNDTVEDFKKLTLTDKEMNILKTSNYKI